MTSRFRRGGDRSGWTGDAPFAGPPALVCPSCGLRNDPSARFCRNCGLPLGWPEDPVRGTTSRQADLPSERGAGVASIIGLLAAVTVLVVAGFLVLRGSGGGGNPGPSHSPTPRPSVAVGSPNPSSSFPVGSNLPSPGVSAKPVITPTPTDLDTQPPGSNPATIGFTCDKGTIGDSSLTRWKADRISSKSFSVSGFDRVTLDLVNQGATNREATISVESLTLDEVATLYSMVPPKNADRAIVVTFEHRVNGFQQSLQSTGMNVVPNVSMGQGSDGLWHVVLGVVGNGCHRIGVPIWDSDPTASNALLNIDVKK